MSEGRVPPSRQRSTRVPLADRAYDHLLLQVIGGDRPPGDWLNIGALSRETGLSATPIREALARLEPTGLIRRTPLRGYEVAPLLSPTEVVQLMDARLLFEPDFAASAAANADEGFLEQLMDTIKAMEDTGDEADPVALKESWIADEHFHTLISIQAGNPFTRRAFEGLGSQLQRFRLSGQAGRTHALQAASEHREIYGAISRGDSDMASELMRAHVETARRRTLADAGSVKRVD